MIAAMKRQIDRALAAIRLPFRGSVGALDMSKPVQRVSGTGLAGESLERLELFQHYGFTSAPPSDAQMIVIPLGGRTSASVVIATEHGQHRLVLTNRGEVALYSQFGNYVHLRADQSVKVHSPVKVVLDTPLTECTQNLKVGGSIEAVGDISDHVGTALEHSMSDMRETYNTHNHNEHDSGATAVPNQLM